MDEMRRSQSCDMTMGDIMMSPRSKNLVAGESDSTGRGCTVHGTFIIAMLAEKYPSLTLRSNSQTRTSATMSVTRIIKMVKKSFPIG
ncbi:MAG: hypothetical protein RR791_04245 [Lachnospiraceae bacterium]